MFVGRVVGRVWAVKKLAGLPPGTLSEIELDSKERHIVAFDSLGCGEGERVLILSGSIAARALGQETALVDAVVIASLEEDDNEKASN